MKSSSLLLLGSLSLGMALSGTAQTNDPLADGFRAPPAAARPQTWWHWMNGNITREGIAADLAAMKDIGLGGATIVNVDCGIPAGNAPFMGPAWRDLLKFTVQDAHDLGLELCIENCAGWSSSGGPWNTPENAMQRVTTSEFRVAGPQTFDATLPLPPTKLDCYHDIAVLAFPAPPDDTGRMQDAHPVASVSSGEAPGNFLTDGDRQTYVRLPAPKPRQPQFAQLTFAQPFAARTVVLAAGPGMPDCGGQIQISDDGHKFRSVKAFAFKKHNAREQLVSLGNQPVVARYWRILFNSINPKVKDAPIVLADIDLDSRLVLDNVDAKDGFSGDFILSAEAPEADGPVAGAIARHDIVDLTSKVSADGHLRWSVPAGSWVILRAGYTPTGVNNHPAPKSGEGLECDKFSTAALDAHWNGFMQKIIDDLGPLAGETLDSSLIDSYEVGGQNWSGNFRAEFIRHRGYDPVPYLPTFTSRVVENPAVSERFLWDIRRTIADLFAEKYYGHFADLCHQHGLKNDVEPYTGPFESLQAGRTADVVMGEFWSGSQGHPSIKLAASVAHIYGKSIVGAESFTASPGPGRWQNDPYSLKALGDLMYCQGLNRCVFHRYASQPWTNRWPGMTMGQWGFHFERTVTWWQQGKGWINYLTHCQYLLQQGIPVADIAYFTGESAPVELRAGQPELPVGYDYDGINADVLNRLATVKDGRVLLPDGVSYAAIVLPPDDINMTPETLRHLRDLVRAGATLVGPRPHHSPSLANYPQCDEAVARLADELWGKCDGTTVLENTVGRGRVVWGKPLADVLAERNLPADFAYHGESKASRLAYVHRVADGADIYFVSNQRRQFDTVDATFRVSGKAPELWHPDTGVMEPAPVWSTAAGRTTVRLPLDPAGSVFVVFRQPAAAAIPVTQANGQFKNFAEAGPKLEVQHAVYAAADGAGKPLDVTAKVTELVQNGQDVLANGDTFGSDPAFLHVKQLQIAYTLAGQVKTATIPEGETWAWPGNLGIGSAPQWETSLAADGTPTVKVWANGTVTLQTGAGNVLHAAANDVPAPAEVTGPWSLSFPPNWGAPPSVTLDHLISWPDSPEAGVRYFSGTATYDRDLEIAADRLAAGREVWLDLGLVKNFAEVTLNGHDLGVLWKPPFRVNLTAAAQPGTNHLVVKVTNLWPNRLIGDEQLPSDRDWDGKQLKAWPQWVLDGKPSPTGRYTFTTWHHWTKDDQLLPSGLIGPVKLETAEIISAR